MFVIYAMLTYFVIAMIVASIILGRVRRKDRVRSPKSFYVPPGRAAVDAPLLHRVTLRGRKLRFYRSPLVGPDFPWTVLRDLFEAVTDGASYTVSAEWIYANNPGLAQVIVTDTGPEMLLSHWAGLELMNSLTPEAGKRAALVGDFRELMAEAYVLQWAGLSREAFLDLCALASRRQHARTV